MRKIDVVLTTLTHEKKFIDQLKNEFAPAEFIHLQDNDSEGIAAALQIADVAILHGDLDDRYLKAPKLKWVHCDHAGLNKSARPEVFAKGLIVTSSAGRSGPALAEHCMFFMLAQAYNFIEFYEAQKRHQYGGIKGTEERRALYGQTVGILGMGNTGKELALRAKAFNMNVIAYRRRDAELPQGVDKIYCTDQGDTVDDFIKELDFLCIALPLTDGTHHLIGEKQLALMKPTAVIVNMGRGSIIDEKALIKALQVGQIGGAGLDTFEEEPLPANSPLWDCPGALLTPHCTPKVPDKTERSINVMLENAKRFRAEQPMLNVLTKEDIYTK